MENLRRAKFQVGRFRSVAAGAEVPMYARVALGVVDRLDQGRRRYVGKQ